MDISIIPSRNEQIMKPQDYGEWTLHIWDTEQTWIKGHVFADTVASVRWYRDGWQIMDPRWWDKFYGPQRKP